MPDYFSAQEIINEAYRDDVWNTGVYKIAALKYIQKNVSVLETLGEKTNGLGPDDPVEITYGELDSIMSTSPTSTSPSRPRPSATAVLQTKRRMSAREYS